MFLLFSYPAHDLVLFAYIHDQFLVMFVDKSLLRPWNIK